MHITPFGAILFSVFFSFSLLPVSPSLSPGRTYPPSAAQHLRQTRHSRPTAHT